MTASSLSINQGAWQHPGVHEPQAPGTGAQDRCRGPLATGRLVSGSAPALTLAQEALLCPAGQRFCPLLGPGPGSAP